MRVDYRRLHRAARASEVSSLAEIITYEDIIQIKIMRPRIAARRRPGRERAATGPRPSPAASRWFRGCRRLRAIEGRDVGAGERSERGVVGAQHRRGQVVDARRLLARHDLVAALANLHEPFLEVLGARVLLVARVLLGDHHGALLGGAESEQDVAGASVEEANSRADSDRDAPITGRIHLGDDRDAGAVIDRQMICLHRADRERAHERRRLRNEPPYGTVEMREPEQLEGQLITVAGVAEDVTAPDQVVRACDNARWSASKRLGDLCLAKAFLLAGQQLEDVQPLVERGSAISVEIVGVGHCVPRQSLVPQERPQSPAGVVDSLESL